MNRIPGRIEFAIFALMAVTCAAVVSLFPRHDYAMMFAAMPLFLVSAVMGLRRNPLLKPPSIEVAEPEDKLVS